MSRARIFFQADYEVISNQFAGLLLAVKKGVFSKNGIDVVLRGRVRPGSEADVVVALQEAFKTVLPSSAPPTIAVGCAEQNIVVPAQALGTPVMAVSAMLQSTPLGLGLLPSSKYNSLADLAKASVKVGMLSDSLTLAQRLISDAAKGSAGAAVPETIEVTNANKFGLLKAGKLDAIQIYNATEPVEIKAVLGQAPKFLPFNSLGYAQAVFAHASVLQSSTDREVLEAFFDGLYKGWDMALDDPKAAAKIIMDERKKVLPQGVGQEPVVETEAYQADCIKRYEKYVRPKGGKSPGTIDPKVWEATNDYLYKTGVITKPVSLAQSLDATLWKGP